MHRAAVAEKALVGIGVRADIVDHQHARVFEPHPDETGEIEHRVTLARRRKEEQRIFRIGLHESFDEFVADFVRALADQRPDRGDDAAAFGAELFHCIDGGFHDARQGAFPSGMGGADHARARIGQQDRSAIGRGGADGKTFGPRHDGIGERPRRTLPGS